MATTASPTRRYTKKITRQAIVNLTEQDTGLVLIMPRASSMELDNGLGDNTEITETDGQGYDTKVANNFGSRKPTINLTFAGRNLDIVALSLDRRTQSVVASLRYPARQQVKRAIYNPSTVGKLGYSIKKDAETKASYHDAATAQTKLLIQQSFDSFNPAIPNSFAVGEHFERKFSSNLVDANSWVVLVPTADYAARSLSEATIGFLELNALCFQTDDTTEIVQVADCFVNPEGAGLKSGDTTVTLDVSGLGKCQPWNLFELNEEIFCDE